MTAANSQKIIKMEISLSSEYNAVRYPFKIIIIVV